LRIVEKNDKVAELLQSHKGIIGEALPPEISQAAEADDTERVGIFIDEDHTILNKKGRCGFTLLHLAAQKSTGEMAQMLINRGAEVNTVDRDGLTPLHHAVSGGFKDVIELLLSHGAEVNVRDKYGRSPLHLVNTRQIAELLVSKGADIHAKDTRYGRTPLHNIAREGLRTDIAEYLILKGINVNEPDYYGATPLAQVRHPLRGRDSSEMSRLIRKYGGKELK
jgi:ankyrin repeat protein